MPKAPRNQGNAQESRASFPQKKFYRQRAHANPPISPQHMDWSSDYPAYLHPDPNEVNLAGARRLVKDVEVVDIGCGFGGLIVALAPLLPDTLMVGMEIRGQVLEFVRERIKALRAQKPAPLPIEGAEQAIETDNARVEPHSTSSNDSPLPTESMAYENISAIRSNTMKFMANFFSRHQLSKIFICFPDPHFKARKHKARIVSPTLNAEYAYALRPGGKLYTITDVEDLHIWMVTHFEGQDPRNSEGKEEKPNDISQLWERLSDEELADDECVRVMKEETEEAKKVTRNNGEKFVAVWRRKEDPEWP
ncbi:tRNA (guanine-N(7)-)-methyltransferase (tRNA(m7G46)-methyltransferase) [Myotisia sp. PD_48]|nr:tRNA (guanine-N(7)-)-methyltransferase (tRNA(m7G46)-methyltransferase) [Myotisia sp. PD_48]